MPLAGHFGCKMVRHAQGLVRCGRVCMRASGPGPSVVSANKCKARRRRRQRDSEVQSSLLNTCTYTTGCAPACCLFPLRGCIVLLQDVTVMAHAAQHMMCACAAVSVCCVVCLCMCARACACECECECFFVLRVPSHFVTVSLWCDIGVMS